ncbi:hypothetical protein RRG08_040430 [Elysia crispata]|uniref:Uncharacterized protein n=1 Tax=Elysia crispata TaxID=231223 RepID=A0AAE1DDW5_9GAST|nr:hypothetical protein RRG08_040430 [Elysia crispata]
MHKFVLILVVLSVAFASVFCQDDTSKKIVKGNLFQKMWSWALKAQKDYNKELGDAILSVNSDFSFGRR